MDVLVIGGTRFFGKRIVEQCLDRGNMVTVLSRGQSRPSWFGRVEHMAGDRTDRESLQRLLSRRRFDAVIDNIAFNRRDVELVLDTLRDGVGHYVLTSTGSVYADDEQLKPIDEGDVDLADVPESYDEDSFEQSYGIHKRQAELVLHERDISTWTVIRPPVVLGPEDPSLRLYWYIQRIMDGQPLLHPVGTWSGIARHIFSEDIARMYLRCLGDTKCFGKTYNAAQLELLTPADTIAGVARALGREVDVVLAPDEALQSELTGWYPPLSFRFVHSIYAARRDLNFTSTPFATWVDLTTRWFATEYSGRDSAGYENRRTEVELASRLISHGNSLSVRLGKPS